MLLVCVWWTQWAQITKSTVTAMIAGWPVAWINDFHIVRHCWTTKLLNYSFITFNFILDQFLESKTGKISNPSIERPVYFSSIDSIELWCKGRIESIMKRFFHQINKISRVCLLQEANLRIPKAILLAKVSLERSIAFVVDTEISTEAKINR